MRLEERAADVEVSSTDMGAVGAMMRGCHALGTCGHMKADDGGGGQM